MAESPCAWVRRRRNLAVTIDFRMRIRPHLRAFPLEIHRLFIEKPREFIEFYRIFQILFFALSRFCASPEQLPCFSDQHSLHHLKTESRRTAFRARPTAPRNPPPQMRDRSRPMREN